MTLTVPSLVGFLIVTGALLACASSRTGQPLYAEYSLDATQHPESIDCFYACLRSSREEFRDVCLTRCEGVVATTTATPCAPGSGALCRSYPVDEEQPRATAEYDTEYDDSEGDAAGFLVELFAAGVDAALSGDGDDRSSTSTRRSERRSSSSPKARPERRKTSSSPKPNLGKNSSSSKSSLAKKSKASSTVTPILRSKSKRD